MQDEGQARLASKLLGTSVYAVSQPDETIGEIQDVVLDPSGKVTHAVISYGGTLGVGEKQTVIPWKALTAGKLETRFVLDRSKLESAPMIDTDQMTADAIPEEIDQYWTDGSVRTAEGDSPSATERR